jgi:hypothetical protein
MSTLTAPRLDGGYATIHVERPSNPGGDHRHHHYEENADVPLAGPSAIEREWFASSYGGGGCNRSLTSIGSWGGSFMSIDCCSERSLTSVDFSIRSEEIVIHSNDSLAMDGAIDAAILDVFADGDDCDDRLGGADVIDDGDIFGPQSIRSSEFVERYLIEERETEMAPAPTRGTQPPMNLRFLDDLTTQLERMSTETLSKDISKETNLNQFSSSDLAEDLSIDTNGMGRMDQSIIDSSDGHSTTHPPPMSNHPEEHSPVNQSNPHTILPFDDMAHTPATNVVPESPMFTADDVLMGKGGHTITHPGNIRFRQKALELRPWYEQSSKQEKYHISLTLVNSARGWGSRFMKKGSDGEWHEVIGIKKVQKKASQALRERL